MGDYRWEHKGYNSVPASDGEAYLASLFGMKRHHNGSLRPDLISDRNQFSKLFSIEVKTGKGKKGILVDYQLHYPYTPHLDYPQMPLFNQKSVLPGMEDVVTMNVPKKSAYYYCVLDRTDGLKTEDFKKPYSSIRCKWGDAFIVPHQWGFVNFALGMARRERREPQVALRELGDMVEEDVLKISGGQRINYDERKGNGGGIQNIFGKDILAVFHDNLELTTKEGRERIVQMWDIYHEMAHLRKVLIEGPNNTKIYVLAEPGHEQLFEEVQQQVENRKRMIEEIYAERRDMEGLIELLAEKPVRGEISCRLDMGKLYDTLSWKDCAILERLSYWLPKEELPEKPDDGIPI